MSKESATKLEVSKEQVAGGLLSPDERQVCKRISAGEAPWSQRSLALLAVDEGATEAEAGERAELRDTQVKYWVGKFHRLRIDIFPKNLLKETEIDLAVPNAETNKEDAPSAKSSGKIKKSKKDKKAKGKKGKVSKKKNSKKSKDKKSKKKGKKKKPK